MIQIKRVYESAEPSDGFRILVDRLWPRGLSKDQAAIDLWFKGIAPSTELRKWFKHDPSKFKEFSQRYRAELDHSVAFQTLTDILQSHPKATLVYAARDPEINHAVILREYIRERL
jgi:uncharacterized protein YeaO (DUF488 family)